MLSAYFTYPYFAYPIRIAGGGLRRPRPCISWVGTQIEPGLLIEVGLCAFSIRDRLSTAAAPHQQ